MHQVAFLRDTCQNIEQLLGHEIALVMRVERVHAVLNDVRPELLVFFFAHAFDVGNCAETHEQVSDALSQVQMVEQALDEVFFRDDVVEELFRPLDEPE